MRYFLPILLTFALFASALRGEWTPPTVSLPREKEHPVITLPPGGLENLKAALDGGPHEDLVEDLIAAGDKAIRSELEFPPRGAHHSQWYNCPECESRLETVSSTEHKCGKCGEVYSGTPYDDVLFRKTHGNNLRRLESAAWAYILTDDEKYAAFARDVLLGYAERYLKYEYRHASRSDSSYARKAGGRIFDQTLTEAYYLQQHIIPAYDLVYNAPVFTSRDHRQIREKLIVPMVEGMLRNDKGKSNWQSFHNTAMFWAGAVLGNEEWMERSIHHPDQGFLFQMENSVLPDGMWHEGSWSYHFYTYRALGRHAQGAGNLGIDLWNHPRFKKMLTRPLDFLMADGSVPRTGDATTARPLEIAARRAQLTEAAYASYQDPKFLPVLSEEISHFTLLYENEDVEGRGKTNSLESLVAESGHAILRTKGDAGLTAALNFAPHGGYHSHFDKLSFVFFGFGEELGVDRGRAASQAYNLPIHKQWYKATVSHNTVLVDGQSQEPSSGELLFFDATDDEVAVVARADEAYPGVSHRRMLFMTPDYLLVFDELDSEEPRRFDWLYHNRGDAVASDLTDASTDLAGLGRGSSYMADAASGDSDGTLRARFSREDLTVHVTEAGASGSRLTTAHGPGSSVEKRIPLVCITREGRGANFAAAIEPVQNGSEPQVRGVTWRSTETGTRIDVRYSEETHSYMLRRDHRVVRTKETQGE